MGYYTNNFHSGSFYILQYRGLPFFNAETDEETYFHVHRNPYKRNVKMRFKETVSRELRRVLLNINWKLFSRAILAHRKNFNFVKGTLHNQQKKIQRMNGPTILDRLHNSRCGNHKGCGGSLIRGVAAHW